MKEKEIVMSNLFEAANIGPMMLRNRFVRSATWEAMATPEGAVTPRLVDTIAALAKGGVGLIISGHAYVRPEGQAGPMQMSAARDDLIPGLRQMADAAHQHGAKIVLQVAHAGYFAAHHLTGTPPCAVSAEVKLDDIPRKELTAGDIGDIYGQSLGSDQVLTFKVGAAQIIEATAAFVHWLCEISRKPA